MSDEQITKAADRFREEASELFASKPSVVFLCGPSLKEATPSAALRKRVKEALEADGFDVVLGEDDGLEEPRLKHGRVYAHFNENIFVEKYCNAVVLIADSVGSFCELGLFSFHKVLSKNTNPDFILIADKQYEDKPSFFNAGPALAIKDSGVVYYVDFSDCDIDPIIDRLKRRRALFVLDTRGRPPGRKARSK